MLLKKPLPLLFSRQTTCLRLPRFALLLEFIVVLVCLPAAAGAAESVPEEIVVTSVTLKNLRADLADAEDDMHDIFNAHVDREFRISCENVAITGSLIEQRVCEPNYRRRAKIRDFRDARDGGTDRLRTTRSSDVLNRDLAEKNAQYQQLMSDLAEQNQAFLDAAVRVLELRNQILGMDGSVP